MCVHLTLSPSGRRLPWPQSIVAAMESRLTASQSPVSWPILHHSLGLVKTWQGGGMVGLSALTLTVKVTCNFNALAIAPLTARQAGLPTALPWTYHPPILVPLSSPCFLSFGVYFESDMCHTFGYSVLKYQNIKHNWMSGEWCFRG